MSTMLYKFLIYLFIFGFFFFKHLYCNFSLLANFYNPVDWYYKFGLGKLHTKHVINDAKTLVSFDCVDLESYFVMCETVCYYYFSLTPPRNHKKSGPD